MIIRLIIAKYNNFKLNLTSVYKEKCEVLQNNTRDFVYDVVSCEKVS